MNDTPSDPIGAALADPRIYQDRDRYHALLTRLRSENPLYRATPQGYRPFWVATRHADIQEIERQPEIFLSGPRLELFSSSRSAGSRSRAAATAPWGRLCFTWMAVNTGSTAA